MTQWSLLAMFVGLSLTACGDDDTAPGDVSDTSHDDGGTDDAVSGEDGTVEGAPPADDGSVEDAPLADDGTGPGNDPCSGNPYTATTPTTTAGTSPPGASAEQQAAAVYVSGIRNAIGLNPINFNAALNQAAQAHSTYCSTDSTWCPGWHDEVPGHPGFTGAQFWDRCAAAGYTGSPTFEVMAPGGSPEFAIDMWMATVYHRTPFVTPEIHEAGFGSGSSYTTMDFGCCGPSDPGLVTNFPVHGQTGVPTSWNGNEGPAPPAPPSGWPSGPVLSVIFPSVDGLHITAHEVFDAACTALAHVAGGADITPNPGFDGSFLRSTIVFYTNAPLQSGRTYTVNVEYTRGGTPGHRTFSFTTM